MIRTPGDVNADWLTGVLRGSGALGGGNVTHVEADVDQRRLSFNAHLRLTYSDESTGARPGRLFLKTCDGGAHGFGQSEVNFYQRDYVGVQTDLLVHCHAGEWSESEARYWLLLEDVSETHEMAVGYTPHGNHAEIVGTGLAQLHAPWHDQHHRIGELGHDEAHIRTFCDRNQRAVPTLLDGPGQLLTAAERRLIERFAERHVEAMVTRGKNPGHTIIHGDVNPTNLLVPRAGANTERVYLIDRQPFDWSLTVWPGAADLADLTISRWDTEMRRALEAPLLSAWQSEMARLGVDVSDADLDADYRLSSGIAFLKTLEWFRPGVQEDWRWLWEPMLHRTLAAFRDLDIQEFWA